jgi:hypothetical protein
MLGLSRSTIDISLVSWCQKKRDFEVQNSSNWAGFANKRPHDGRHGSLERSHAAIDFQCSFVMRIVSPVQFLW